MKSTEKLKIISIDKESSILEALRQMDITEKRLLIVFFGSKFFGLLSIGDIQRALIKGVTLESKVEKILRRDITVASKGDSFESIKSEMLENRIECMPVIDKENNLVDIYYWEEVFGAETKRKQVVLNLPVVIMAGGKGSRLEPLTNVLPKPMIPLGKKTIMEEIMDKFIEVGCCEFHISVNYKADMIKHYFKSINSKIYKIKYFQEPQPLGTAGSMYLLKKIIHSTFFVSNCDILIDQDIDEIYRYHLENKNDITIVAALKHYKIPYGTIETGENGILKELYEKPELTFQINSGFYILEPKTLQLIPDNQFFHITDLINAVKINSGRVGVFPVSEGSWKDIGEWDEYLKNKHT